MIMKDNNKVWLLMLTALLSGASFAEAQARKPMQIHVQPAAQAKAPKIIAIQAWVENQRSGERNRYGIAPENESVPVRDGDRLRISLVGTDVSSGIGREVPLNASWSPAAGRGQLSVLRSGGDWVEVEVRGTGTSQLGYNLRSGADIRQNMASGRLTFEAGGRGGSTGRPGRGDSGGSASQQVVGDLYRAILERDPRGRDIDDDVASVERGGQVAARDLALQLAEQADRQGLGRSRRSRGYEDEDRERVADLYRILLGRDQSADQLWAQDRGFRGQVEALHERGLARVVQSIVDSDEFRSRYQLDGRGGRRR
jgi:hypothetical protein